MNLTTKISSYYKDISKNRAKKIKVRCKHILKNKS